MGWGSAKSKYKNVRISHAGYSFASKGEAALFDLLKLREIAGEIREIKHQDSVFFGRERKKFVPDFKFFDIKSDTYRWAEFKGFEQADWPWKRVAWMLAGPGLLDVYKGSHTKIFLFETLVPDHLLSPNTNASTH